MAALLLAALAPVAAPIGSGASAPTSPGVGAGPNVGLSSVNNSTENPTAANPATAAPPTNVSAASGAAKVTAHLDVGHTTETVKKSFFGVNGETVAPSAYTTVPRLETFLNQSPIGLVRYSAGEDTCNITSDVSWNPGILGGVATPGCGYDVAAFAQWCDSLTPHCQSDVGLPGEQNNSALDAYYAQYIVKTLHFQPTYWSIGNEPISWTHYGIPWSSWKLTDNSAPTGIAYAVDVKNAIAAVLKVDPAAKFVGLQSYWCPDKTYTEPVAALDGDQIAAIACHVYPNDGVAFPNTKEYFASLIGPHNITTNYLTLRDRLQGLCSKCDDLPIQIAEYQGGPVGSPAHQDRQFDGAVWLAASLVQALNVGIPSVQLYELQGSVGCQFCMLGATYYPDPQGLLYLDVLEELHRGHYAHNVTVQSHITNLWATLVHSKTTNDTQILFVNANLSRTATFALSTRYFAAGEPGSIISWNSSGKTPTKTTYRSLPAELSVPPLSLVLISVAPRPSSAGHAGASAPLHHDSAPTATAIPSVAHASAWPPVALRLPPEVTIRAVVTSAQPYLSAPVRRP